METKIDIRAQALNAPCRIGSVCGLPASLHTWDEAFLQSLTEDWKRYPQSLLDEPERSNFRYWLRRSEATK